jgi:hypothetical protein
LNCAIKIGAFEQERTRFQGHFILLLILVGYNDMDADFNPCPSGPAGNYLAGWLQKFF